MTRPCSVRETCRATSTTGSSRTTAATLWISTQQWGWICFHARHAGTNQSHTTTDGLLNHLIQLQRRGFKTLRRHAALYFGRPTVSVRFNPRTFHTHRHASRRSSSRTCASASGSVKGGEEGSPARNIDRTQQYALNARQNSFDSDSRCSGSPLRRATPSSAASKGTTLPLAEGLGKQHDLLFEHPAGSYRLQVKTSTATASGTTDIPPWRSQWPSGSTNRRRRSCSTSCCWSS